MEQKQNQSIRDFIHSLDPNQRIRFLAFLLSRVETRTIFHWDVERYPDLVDYTSVDGSLHSGNYWSKWAACIVVVSKVDEHFRYQINLKQNCGAQFDWGIKTPSKRSKEGTPIAKRLKRLLGNDSTERAREQWSLFKEACSPSGVATKRPAVKIWLHWVALCCRHDLVDQNPIPANCGSGGSVGHDCDQGGCVTSDHLRPELQHVDNLSRQRCLGVQLLVLGRIIVAERPCAHIRDGDIATCCRKLQIIELPIDATRGALAIYDSADQSGNRVVGEAAGKSVSRRLIGEG